MKVNGYKIEFGANLEGANLEGVSLKGAILRYANLRGANLRSAILRRADLRGADLIGADLRGADLIGTNLEGTNLEGANLEGAYLPDFQITPKGYPMYGFKKLGNEVVCTILIPKDAERTASLVGRKCRAEYAVVVDGDGPSQYDPNLIYEVGETVHPDSYNPDIRLECTHGIHFFLTPEEAEDW